MFKMPKKKPEKQKLSTLYSPRCLYYDTLVTGWMYDHMGNYRVAFHVAGAPPILGAILMFLIPKVEQVSAALSCCFLW